MTRLEKDCLCDLFCKGREGSSWKKHVGSIDGLAGCVIAAVTLNGSGFSVPSFFRGPSFLIHSYNFGLLSTDEGRRVGQLIQRAYRICAEGGSVPSRGFATTGFGDLALEIR
ncbi:hypothetical protein CEXT_568631 [Caerostris extrusa]|uniref:Uncharacterized protein n=1 Tax=Caerostris extrusa TaxID=172846 RepID=A0AAV4Y9C5_CAEEX|nr:hypothetical protein CEXT_568631 [Caerostris extrusa]